MPVFYPLNDSKHSFAYSHPIWEDTMTIFSVYNTTTQSHIGDVITMFGSVPVPIWIGFLVCFSIYCLISYVGTYIMERHSSNPIWMSVCTFLDQDNHPDYYPSKQNFFAILCSVTMIGLFFIMTFRDNYVSTDIITVDKPVVISTYDDIIEHGVHTGFASITPEWEIFKNAPLGSKEREIFERSFEINFSATTFLSLLEGLINQKKCIIGRPFIAKLVAVANVASLTWIDECECYVAPDPEAKKYAVTFVWKPSLDAQIMKSMNKWILRVSAHGFVHRVLERSFNTIIEPFMQKGALPPSKMNKITSHIEEQSGNIIDLSMEHYKRVFIISFGLIVVAFYCLLLEIIWSMKSRSRRTKHMNKNKVRIK